MQKGVVKYEVARRREFRDADRLPEYVERRSEDKRVLVSVAGGIYLRVSFG